MQNSSPDCGRVCEATRVADDDEFPDDIVSWEEVKAAVRARLHDDLSHCFRIGCKNRVRDAAIWYESQRRGLGDEFTFEISRAVEKAAESPARYPLVFGDIRRTVARRFPYEIYFRIRGSVVVVLAVFHGRRDFSMWQRRA